jgi:hypothetical protein
MVLTALLRREAGVLHAEHYDPEPSVGWFIAPPGWRGEQTDAPVAVSPSRGAFRSVLARFGHHYMSGQLYHGYALRFLRQRGRLHRCHIYMSNTGQSGFWIEIYAARKAEQAVQRTGASRFAQRQIERHRRLPPVADLFVGRIRAYDHAGPRKAVHPEVAP